MNFTQAIGSAFRRYAEFSGRSCRSEYWYFVLFSVVASICLGVLDAAIFPQYKWAPLGLVFSLAIFLPSIAIGVRRLHDINRSGWWYFLGFIPVIGWIVLIVWACRRGDVGANRFGPDPLAGEAEAVEASP